MGWSGLVCYLVGGHVDDGARHSEFIFRLHRHRLYPLQLLFLDGLQPAAQLLRVADRGRESQELVRQCGGNGYVLVRVG